MTAIVIVGAQPGDEGKGKTEDEISELFGDIVVRTGGGPNAGHTLWVNRKKYVTHQIPSGVVSNRVKQNILAAGMFLNPKLLVKELNEFGAGGFDVSPSRIWIAPQAHMILPTHIELDIARDASDTGGIGTTKQGMGPAAADKVTRRGLQIGMMRDRAFFQAKLTKLMNSHAIELELLHSIHLTVGVEAYVQEQIELADILEPYIHNDIPQFLREQLRANHTVVFEGAQGGPLDINHGTFPYVSVSSVGVGEVMTSCGLSLESMDGAEVIGVCKATTTRVGAGSFPTELHGPEAAELREAGDEYGSTTHRPRRCGHLDLVWLKHTLEMIGATCIAINKIDILKGRPLIRAAIGYMLGSQRYDTFPSHLLPHELDQLVPVYQDFEGFTEDLSDVRSFNDLPRNVQQYFRFIERFTGLPIRYIGVGPERGQIIHC